MLHNSCASMAAKIPQALHISYEINWIVNTFYNTLDRTHSTIQIFTKLKHFMIQLMADVLIVFYYVNRFHNPNKNQTQKARALNIFVTERVKIKKIKGQPFHLTFPNHVQCPHGMSKGLKCMYLMDISRTIYYTIVLSRLQSLHSNEKLLWNSLVPHSHLDIS